MLTQENIQHSRLRHYYIMIFRSREKKRKKEEIIIVTMQYNILIKKHILIEHKHIQLQLKVIKLFGYVLRDTRDNKYPKKKT